MDNSLLEAALDYATRGWPIFPTRVDKTPYTPNGVLDATTDERQVREWWARWPGANVALDVGGAGMMVLDLDPGHKLEELEKNVGKIPETKLQTRTPRQGEHLFFALADDEVVPPSSSKLAAHVDVRSFHSYVLLPPSSTKDGEYIWLGDGKPSYRTDEMLRIASAAVEKHPDRDNWIIEPDLEANLRLAEQWLRAEARPAIEGRGGDHCAYATAGMMIGYGISEEAAFELMWEHWNPRCDPPWEAGEADHLRQKVENAYRYHSSPPGRLTPAYHRARTSKLFEVVRADLPGGEETRVAGFRFADRAALRHIRPPRWVVTDLIPDEGYAMLFGAWHTFKTFLALDLCLRVALGYQPVDELWRTALHGPVLFAAGEGRSNLAKRISAWEGVHNWGAEVPDFILVDPVPTTAITEEYLRAFVDEALRRHPEGYLLTVIDTVGRSIAGTDENSQQAASAFTDLVQRLRAELGGSVLALHHSGHLEERRARGSSVFGADPDTVVRVDREGGSYVVNLTMTKQRDAPEWEGPRHAKLREVHLGKGIKTLVAVLPGEEDLPAARGDERAADALFLNLLDRELVALLSSNPAKSWTQGDLADALAMRETITVPGRQLREVHLARLRETNDTAASRCYDPMRSQKAGRWRWVEKED